jgi:hypothetical protein
VLDHFQETVRALTVEPYDLDAQLLWADLPLKSALEPFTLRLLRRVPPTAKRRGDLRNTGCGASKQVSDERTLGDVSVVKQQRYNVQRFAMRVAQACARKSLRCDHFMRRASTKVDIVFSLFWLWCSSKNVQRLAASH